MANDLRSVEEAYQCTRSDCQRLFVAVYRQTTDRYYKFESVRPVTSAPPAVPELVAAVSPNFVEIYGQALAAEAHELNQISGTGLRKALEFLVKDFAVHLEPSKQDEIRSKPLGSCIRDHITDPNLNAAAKLATWVGNDETHYVRRWDDKDVQDLKRLIRLAINAADSVLVLEKYEKDMRP